MDENKDTGVNKRSRIMMIVAVAGLIICVVAATMILIKKYAPTNEKMSLNDYYGIQTGQVKVILNAEVSETLGIYQDGRVYLDIDFINNNLNKKFYWDSRENKLIYTTSNTVLTTELNSQELFTNNSKESLDHILVKSSGEKTFVDVDFVKEHTAMDYKIYKNPERIVINTVYGKKLNYIKTTKESAIRYRAGVKSKILKVEDSDTEIRLLEEKVEDTVFCKVMSSDGVIGYMKRDRAGETYKKQHSTDFKDENYTHILSDGKVNIGWQQVTTEAANKNLTYYISRQKGINVISPTWFETADDNGNINSLASDDYVTEAHKAGLKVWGMCDDFTPGMKIGTVLSSTTTRTRLEKNLMAEAIKYSLDGINIDFENVKSENGKDFVQFIRELGIMCRNNGVVLSVNNYPLRDYNAYYDPAEQAQVADYVIVMAYDEYNSNSQSAGPVSSLSYVQTAITALKDIVPSNQIIAGLPFYSRHWVEKTTSGGKVKLSSKAVSMSEAAEIAGDSGANITMDENAGMNYVEFVKGKGLHKIWIEDKTSLEKKMTVVKNENVAGMAFWRLGLEEKNIWETIVKYEN